MHIYIKCGVTYGKQSSEIALCKHIANLELGNFKKTMYPKKVLSKQLLNWICMMIAANCIFNRIILWCLGKESWKVRNKLFLR